MSAVGGPPLHPAVEVLGVLLGTWVGRGVGSYPTIETFEYDETITFGHVGKPFLTYTQRTTARDDGRPLHAEAGYLRGVGGDQVEFVVAHPTGVTELSVGSFVEGRLCLVSATVACSPSAKSVTGVERDFTVGDDELTYELRMAAVGLAMTHHLAATLRRV